MAKRIDPESLDLIGGARAAKRFAAYVRQEGKDALPMIQRAVLEGSVGVREAAIVAMAAFDPGGAVRLVEAELAKLKKKPPKKELAALARCLFVAGAYDRGLDLVLERQIKLDVTGLGEAALIERVLARLPQLVSLVDILELVQQAPAEVQRRAYLALLDDPAAGELRDRATERLLQLGDAASLAGVVERAGSLPAAAKVRALLGGDPRVAYEELADAFRSDAPTRSAVLSHLDDRADPRWAQEVLAIVSEYPHAAMALAQLKAFDELADLAVRPTLDDIAREALYALGKVGDPRATQLLLSWLDSPEGEVRAPMLLAALADCGDATAIPVLEGKLAGAGQRRSFYQHAITSIRSRAV